MSVSAFVSLGKAVHPLAAAVCFAAAGAGTTAGAAVTGDGAGTDGLAFFENRVRPVLVEHCYACHSAEAKKIGGSFTLDTREGLLKGGIDGVVVVPGDPEASLLVNAIRQGNPELQMPPPKSGRPKLPDAAIADLAAWVKMGAPYPASAAGPARVAAKLPWSFAPIQDPAPPPVRDAAWARTSVDPFILAEIEARGLHPAPPADQLPLLRRVTYDLTGLPPTPAEVDAFLADPLPEAFAKVVDRLLASPAYGEHWGRHWLDVARYADTAGDTADYPVPEAWRYRNYVIDSFNANKPYDQFLREQIAGDILARESPPEHYAEQVTATGYLALSRRFGFDSENYHHLTIQDTLDTLGQSVLGLTVGCARCHDHKFDPVTTRDYYGLYGIFAGTRYAFPGSEQKGRFRAMVPLVPEEESREKWQEWQAGFAALEVKPEAVLRSLDEMDGDFEMQRAAAGGSNGVLVPPWFYEGKVSVTPSAQSPFRHLYPFGGAGAAIVPGGDYAIWQHFHPALTKGMVYVNLEFRAATSDPAARGRHRFAIGAPDAPLVEALIANDSVTLSTGPIAGKSGGAAVKSEADGRAETGQQTVLLPKPGEWQCLQLAIDLQARTCSGSVGTPGQVSGFGPLPLRPAAEAEKVSINRLTLDSRKAGPGPLPGLEVDNLAVSPVPPPPVATDPPGNPAASALVPALASLQAELRKLAGMDGDLESQVNGTAPAGNWHPGPNSAVTVSAGSQSPFTNVYPAGSLGLHLPATAGGAYNGFGNHLPQAWKADAVSGPLFVGFDFRCLPGNAGNAGAGAGADASEKGGGGTWRLHFGHSYTSPAVRLEINPDKLFQQRTQDNEPVATLRPGEWHQVQLVLDLKAKTYTGSLANREEKHEFSGAFAAGWDGVIDYLFIDSGGQAAGSKAELDTDNFLISTTPPPALTAPAAELAGDPQPSRLDRIRELRQQISEVTTARQQRLAVLNRQLDEGPVPMAYGVSEGTPQSVHLQIRGEPDKPGALVPRGFIQSLGHAGLPQETTGSGRIELAQWLTRPDNPLTARVMANRLWQYHFGRGLVATPNDFGTRSTPPTHPALLDHLATQFMRSGWSVKAMHRLILLSATWQQSSIEEKSSVPASAMQAAAAREWYAVFPRLRLSAEEIRDAILATSGTLDSTPGTGHPFPPAHTWGYTQHAPFTAVYDHDKRSVYLMVQRIKRHPFLALFDGADPNASTADRRLTTVPTQALYFLNDSFVHDKSRKLAARLQAASTEPAAQVELATRLTLGRPPSMDEQAEAAEFLTAYRQESGPDATSLDALAAWVRTLFGSNEFLHCD